MTIALKKHFNIGLNALITQKVSGANQSTGRSYPVRVVSVENSFVTVAFDLNTPYTLPQVTVPVMESKYIRLPIQVGDLGIVISADTYIGNVTGVNNVTPDLTPPFNLSALVYVPVSNMNWASINPNAVVITAPNSGPIILDATSVIATQNLSAGNGLTGTFTTGTGQTVQVDGGIITNIY